MSLITGSDGGGLGNTVMGLRVPTPPTNPSPPTQREFSDKATVFNISLDRLAAKISFGN